MLVGSAIVNFGSAPGSNEASVAVTGQASILSSSVADTFIMADDTTTDHTASDHRYIGRFMSLTCGAVTAGTGFTIYARSEQKLQGTFAVRWVWS